MWMYVGFVRSEVGPDVGVGLGLRMEYLSAAQFRNNRFRPGSGRLCSLI